MAYLTAQSSRPIGGLRPRAGADELEEPNRCVCHMQRRGGRRRRWPDDMYLRAREHDRLEDEFQPVLELMQQAVQAGDPQAEYYLLLGEVQEHNPEVGQGVCAVASYRKAVRCRPDDADLRLKFAKALEDDGGHSAGIQYRVALN